MSGLMRFVAAFFALSLAACGGGGGGGGSNPPQVSPPSALTYPSPQTFTLNAAITALPPTVTGAPTGYSVSPALPAGLTLSSITGVISGAATALQTTTIHTVTATNAGGSTTAGVSITVNDVFPSISFPQTAYTFSTGSPLTALVPTATGGAVVSWTISATLPAGLVFNTISGRITGTPSATSASTTYVVTATNSGGSDTFDLTLAVSSGVLLELGHRTNVSILRMSGNRAMSMAGETVLWNTESGARIFTSQDAGALDLAGNTAAFGRSTDIELRAASDGSLLANIPSVANAPYWRNLATDGSYVAAGNGDGLTIWSRTGSVLYSRTGNYARPKVFAAPGELRIAGLGNVIEYIPVPGSTLTTSPVYLGTFQDWFLDGDRFFTRTGNMVWIYSSAGVLVDSGTVPQVFGVGGRGNWFWVPSGPYPGSLVFYTVGGGFTTPTATIPGVSIDGGTWSGTTFARFVGNSRAIAIVDISGAMPVRTDYEAPVGQLSTFAANSASDWMFSNQHGVVMGEVGGGAPQVYSLGDVYSIAGGTNHVAVATASGSIFHFDPVSHSLEGMIESPSSKLVASTDGSILAAEGNQNYASYYTDRTLKVFQLPSENVLIQRPADFTTFPYPVDFTMSASATTLAQTMQGSNDGTIPSTREVTQLNGTQIWSETLSVSWPSPQPLRLSPNGNLIAATNGTTWADTATRIYNAGTFVVSVPGSVVGWIDDSRLLVSRFVDDQGSRLYLDSAVISSTGILLNTLPHLPQLTTLQAVGGNSVYSPEVNIIFDVTTGATVWSSSAIVGGEGAVAGSQVVFSSGATVRIEPR